MTMKKIFLVSAMILALGGIVFAQGYYGHRGDYGGGYGGYGHRGRGGYDGRGRYDDRGDYGYGRGCGGYGHRGDYGGYGHRGRGGYDGRYNYTQEDYAKIDSIYQKYSAEIDKNRADMYSKDLAIRAEMSKDTPDQTKMDALIDDISKLRSDMAKLRIKIDTEIESVLKK